jgi:hypothetical protein
MREKVWVSFPQGIGDIARDDEGDNRQDDKRGDRAVDDGALGGLGALLGGLRACGQPRLGLAFHFEDDPANLVHRLFTLVRADDLQGGFRTTCRVLAGVNRLLQLREFAGDLRLQRGQQGHLVGIGFGQVTERGELLVDGGAGGVVGIEIFVFPGEQKTTLPSLGILEGGLHGLEHFEHLVRLGDEGRCLRLLDGALVSDRADGHEDGQGEAKAQRQLRSDICCDHS